MWASPNHPGALLVPGTVFAVYLRERGPGQVFERTNVCIRTWMDTQETQVVWFTPRMTILTGL